jgi:hypothetical protein
MEYINGKVSLFDEVWNLISCYDEEYAHEQGIDILDNEDVYNIVSDILDNNEIQEIIMAEIESHAGYKKNRMIEEV